MRPCMMSSNSPVEFWVAKVDPKVVTQNDCGKEARGAVHCHLLNQVNSRAIKVELAFSFQTPLVQLKVS